ncbi:MAG: outer membrane beta-barrel protein [Pyrinomonadaceae bacterium]
MSRTTLNAIVAAVLFFAPHSARAQTETPRYEVGAQFTSLTKPGFGQSRTDPGFGGRFTYNITDYLAIEAETNFFPEKSRFNVPAENQGNAVEGLFGVKAGKRFSKFGIYGKARPGFISFSQGKQEIIPPVNTPANQFLFFDVRRSRLTNFAMDVGGVLEFYPSRHIVTRFEAGDTIIRYRERTINGITSFDQTTGQYTFSPFTIQGDTRSNFQFSAGVGYRF